jgi:hypothetical protein
LLQQDAAWFLAGERINPIFPAMDILENTSVQAAAMPRPRQRPRLPTDAQARRVEELRRAFQRALNRRPTLIEKAAMLRAAALVARAETAALDQTVPVAELTKLVNIADRAVRRLPLDGERPAKLAAALRTLELRRERWAGQDRARKAAEKAREAHGEEHDTESTR